MTLMSERLKSTIGDFIDDDPDYILVSSFENVIWDVEHLSAKYSRPSDRVQMANEAYSGVRVFLCLVPVSIALAALFHSMNPASTLRVSVRKVTKKPSKEGKRNGKSSEQGSVEDKADGGKPAGPIFSSSDDSVPEKLLMNVSSDPAVPNSVSQPSVSTAATKLTGTGADVSPEPSVPDLVEELPMESINDSPEDDDVLSAASTSKLISGKYSKIESFDHEGLSNCVGELNGYSHSEDTLQNRMVAQGSMSNVVIPIDRKRLEETARAATAFVQDTEVAIKCGIHPEKAHDWIMERQKSNREHESRVQTEQIKAYQRQQQFHAEERRHQDTIDAMRHDSNWREKLEKARDDCYSASVNGFTASIVIALFEKMLQQTTVFLQGRETLGGLVLSMACGCNADGSDPTSPYDTTDTASVGSYWIPAFDPYESIFFCGLRWFLIVFSLITVHWVFKSLLLPGFFHSMTNIVAVLMIIYPSWRSPLSDSNVVKATLMRILPHVIILVASIVLVWKFHSRTKCTFQRKGDTLRADVTDKEVLRFGTMYWVAFIVPILFALANHFDAPKFIFQQFMLLMA